MAFASVPGTRSTSQWTRPGRCSWLPIRLAKMTTRLAGSISRPENTPVNKAILRLCTKLELAKSITPFAIGCMKRKPLFATVGKSHELFGSRFTRQDPERGRVRRSRSRFPACLLALRLKSQFLTSESIRLRGENVRRQAAPA